MKKSLFAISFALVVFFGLSNFVNAATIRFYDEDNGNNIGYMFVVFDTPREISIEAPEREGFIYTGWSSNDENAIFGEDNTISVPWRVNDFRNMGRTVDVFATWAQIYTITYDLDGGEVLEENPETYTELDEFVINNPTKEGYEFLGWSNEDGEFLGDDVEITLGTTGDLTFIATYREVVEEEEETPVVTPVVVNNPKTGDSVLVNIVLIIAGLVSILGAKVFGKKNVTNN